MEIVVAYDAKTRGIGFQGKIPWKPISEDLRFFKTLTVGPNPGRNVVIMGRKTWISLPKESRPLVGRINVVLTRGDPDEIHKVPMANLLEENTFLTTASCLEDVRNVVACEISPKPGTFFIIGGSEVYKEAIAKGLVYKIVATELNCTEEHQFDRFFPPLLTNWTEDGLSHCDLFSTVKYVKEPSPNNPDENSYLALISKILILGEVRQDRTGTGTISLFGESLKFSLLNDTLPLLTTKRVFWRGIAEELLWFISGSTDSKILSNKKIGIWDSNSTREFLDKRGLAHYHEGDLGPIYGFQWRHWGASYNGKDSEYTNRGFDQLKKAIDTIKTNPTDRRIIVSAWNVSDIDRMALPPCHILFQLYVSGTFLSCSVYQRSCDMGLGIPFNIASYALLTHLVAKVCGLKAKELIFNMGDCHVYTNHVEALKEQLRRRPYKFPKLRINKETDNIDDFTFSDLEVIGYNCHDTISMPMAV